MPHFCFPVRLFVPWFRWRLPKITVLRQVLKCGHWQDEIWSVSVSLGCVMGFCSQWISSHQPYKVEDVCLYRLMGHKSQETLGAPLDQQVQGYQDYLSHHGLRFYHPFQCRGRRLHLRKQKHVKYYVNLKWKMVFCKETISAKVRYSGFCTRNNTFHVTHATLWQFIKAIGK